MGKIIVLIFILILGGILWALPLYLVINFLLFLFSLPYHLTLLQAFGLCLLANVIKNLIFRKGE